jgi:hypothetical protein
LLAAFAAKIRCYNFLIRKEKEREKGGKERGREGHGLTQVPPHH